MTTLRLAATTAMLRASDEAMQARYPFVRLAHQSGSQCDNTLMGDRGVKKIPDELRPALLVSFVYLDGFLKNQTKYAYRDWALDSGAFSAHNSGTPVDLNAYIECCHKLMETDPTLTEIFSLDVIGDWKASIKNTEKMWTAGIPAIPCYHIGEPEDALFHIAKEYPKVALGGVAREKEKKRFAWAKQCFARIWPKKIHGFGFCTEKTVLGLPFHSVDATSWEIGPCGFGTWRTYGKLSIRGSKQNLRVEVEWYLRLEERARQIWRREMEKLEASEPTIRLAVQAQSGRSKNPYKEGEHG